MMEEIKHQIKDHTSSSTRATREGNSEFSGYLLPGVRSEPQANAAQTEYCKELPLTLISALIKG